MTYDMEHDDYAHANLYVAGAKAYADGLPITALMNLDQWFPVSHHHWKRGWIDACIQSNDP